MAWFSEKAFHRTGRLMQKAGAVSQSSFGPLVKRLTPVEDSEYSDWEGEADWARLQQDPLRARLLMRVVGITLIVLIVWSAFAKVDEVTRGEARVVPTSQVQIVQSVDGGIVEELMVKEGQVVEVGSGLLPTDRVIDSPPDGLADGDPVRVLEPKADAGKPAAQKR